MSNQLKRFVLSDSSSINSKGYKIDINGLDISRFATNPVMLYEHNPEKVIGRWNDIKKDTKQLTAIPEFDLEDAEALSIAGKVERGFLNAASIGIIVYDMTEVDGVDVVTRSELFEASIVSVPADAGAVRLYNEKRECLSIDKLKLSINKQKQDKMDYKENFIKICEALGLDAESDIETVLSAIKKLTKTSGETEIEEALNLGILTVSEHHLYIDHLRKGQTSVLSIVAEKKQDFEHIQDKQVMDLYNSNSDKIVTYLGAEGWKEMKNLAKQGLSFDTLKKIVDNLPERVFLSNMIIDRNKEAHDLDWYRKHNPKALRENPELYQSLLKSYNQQKGITKN